VGVVAWIVFGLILGMVASCIAPGRGGILAAILVGIVGAFVGGSVYALFGHAGVTAFNIPSMGCALIGSVLLLWFLRAVSSMRSSA
jgi:uncharacterized membrane protein YeaQ/YmgE (transglycosylase-associated protein family)